MVQLVGVAERSSLWAHQYNEELTDFFAVQDSISAQVAAALETELTDQERSGLARRATESPAAYEAYLRGRAIWHSYTEEGMAAAIRYFRTAAELDPGFGAAHSGIADIHIALGISSVMPPGEAFAIAKASAKKAIELDPRSAEAYASLGFAVWATDWDAARSEELFERSFLLNENYAAAYEWFAHVLASQMRFDEAIGLMKRALRIDPNSSQLYAMTAYILHNARRAHEAVFYIERSVELDPENYIGLQGFGWIYPAIGRTREAIPYCRKALEISGHAPFCVWTLAQVLAQAGERAEAESLLEQLKRISSTRYVSPYYAAMVNTTLGRYDEAFRSLEKAFDDHDYWAQWLPVEYRFDPIRGDDRYAKLIDRLGRERKGKSGVEPPGTVDPAARAPRTIRAAAVVLLLVIAGVLGGIFLIKGRTAEQGGVEPRIKVTRVTSEGSVMYSAISPDGSSTVYVKEEGGRQSVWTKRIGSANSELLIAPSDLKFAAPTYSPDGRTLYYVAQRRDRNTGTLYAMPAVAGGQSRKIIEDVYGKVDIAPDGRQIAFRRRRLDPSEDSIFVAGEDGSNPKLIASRKYPGTLTNPSFSPDGKTLAYGAVNAGEEGSEQYATITLSPLNGGPARDVGGKRWSMLTYVAWRPDGKGLYVAGQENIDSANIQIWQVSLDGSQYTRLTNDAENYRGISAARGSAALLTVKSELTSSMWIVPDPSDAPDEQKADRLSAGSLAGFRGLAWAPNGSIVYTVYENSVVEIWRADADGSNPRRLIRRAGDSYLPAISPDGRYVVYVSEEQGAPDLWRLDLNGGENIQLTRGGGDRSPQFTADSRTIVFTRVVAGRRVLAKMPVEGREAQQIGDFAADMPAISPDGRTIAFLLVDDSGGRIALMPVDGDRPTKIFDIPLSVAARPYHSAVLRWSSDGGAVAYIHDQNGPPNVWAQPVNGGSPRQITFFNTGEIFYFDFARDGRLALAQGMQVSDAVLFSIGD
jgi:Tol biopolymer transport system component/tetratricopeptide (TPR) repeat protein